MIMIKKLFAHRVVIHIAVIARLAHANRFCEDRFHGLGYWVCNFWDEPYQYDAPDIRSQYPTSHEEMNLTWRQYVVRMKLWFHETHGVLGTDWTYDDLQNRYASLRAQSWLFNN